MQMTSHKPRSLDPKGQDTEAANWVNVDASAASRIAVMENRRAQRPDDRVKAKASNQRGKAPRNSKRRLRCFMLSYGLLDPEMKYEKSCSQLKYKHRLRGAARRETDLAIAASLR